MSTVPQSGRASKSKHSTASATHSKSPESPHDEVQNVAQSNGRSAKRVKEDEKDNDEPHPSRKAKTSKKGKQPPPPDESASDAEDEDHDGEGGEEDDGGETRCVCGQPECDDGGLMVMCETCKCWQHTRCMKIPEDSIPEHYYCEVCRPELHEELLKSLHQVRRQRRRSSATRTHPRNQSRSQSPTPVPKPKSPKRRSTMNSRDAAYDELLLQASKNEVENEEEIMNLLLAQAPGRRNKRSTITAHDETNLSVNTSVPTKRPGSISATSEQQPQQPPSAVEEMAPTPIPEPNEEPGPEHQSEEEVQAPPPPQRGKRGAGGRKSQKPVKPPSPVPEVEGEVETPARNLKSNKQPNQYSHRKGVNNSPAKRGNTATTQNLPENGKRAGNGKDKSAVRASSPTLLTSWQLPDHLSHLAGSLPSDVPRALDIRAGVGQDPVQERGVKVKWPAKRTTIGDMNKRVRYLFEVVTREQMQHAERQSRVQALEAALKDGRYKAMEPPSDAMDVDVPAEEDVKPDVELELPDQPENDGPRTRSSDETITDFDNEIARWNQMSTDAMLEDLLSEILLFQEKYRPRSRRKEHGATSATA